MRPLTLLPALFFALPALAQDLPVRAVTLSNAGLAQIERAGRVAPGAPLTFRVPVEDVDDVLKSLLVRDAGGTVEGVRLAAHAAPSLGVRTRTAALGRPGAHHPGAALAPLVRAAGGAHRGPGGGEGLRRAAVRLALHHEPERQVEQTRGGVRGWQKPSSDQRPARHLPKTL